MLEKRETPLAKFIKDHADRSERSYEEIAILCGFKTDALVHGFTRGEVRLPLDKVTLLAQAIGCDDKQLFRLTLKAWFSDEIFDQMQDAFLPDPSTGIVERNWLQFIRELIGGELPEMSDQFRRRLRLVLRST